VGFGQRQYLVSGRSEVGVNEMRSVPIQLPAQGRPIAEQVSTNPIDSSLRRETPKGLVIRGHPIELSEISGFLG